MSPFSVFSWNVRSKAPTRSAESRVFLLTVLFLNNELAGLARGILLRRYLTKKSQARAKTRMATTRQMMARPQPGIGWSGVTAVVITELVELQLVLLLNVVLVVLNTVDVDADVVVVVENVVDVDVVVVVVVGMMEVEEEAELSSVVVEPF